MLYFDASLRFDSDFGGYMLGRPTGVDEIRELKQSQLDILYAFLGGRNVGGRVDFQLGRQIHFDLVDFFAFDGGDALVHVTRNFGVEAFAGTEVRGELPLSAPIYELDGTSAGLARSGDAARRRAEMLRPLAARRWLAGATAGRWSARLAYRRVWSATADRLPGEPDIGRQRREAVADRDRRLAQPRLPRGRRALQPAAGRVRRRAAGAAAAARRRASG